MIFRTLLISLIALSFSFNFSYGNGYGPKTIDTRKQIAACPEKAGNIYYAYNFEEQKYTPAPKGYEAFYISHYGRHGSRWLLRENEYQDVKNIFIKAENRGLLTGLGKEVYSKVLEICEDGEDRFGELTMLGAAQHREIATRMFHNFPQIFRKDVFINAESTHIPRCIMSMANFCLTLEALSPGVDIKMETGRPYTRFLNCMDKTLYKLPEEYKNIKSTSPAVRENLVLVWKKYLNPQRLVGSLFSDKDFLDEESGRNLMFGLFLFAVNIQDTSLDLSLFDIFTPDELYNLAVYDNWTFFTANGPSAQNKGYPQRYVGRLMTKIILDADSAVSSEGRRVDLRFGHDTNVMPLVSLFGFTDIDYCPDATDPVFVFDRWAAFEITPMGANTQIIFYRSKGKSSGKALPVIVKILHNEKEMRLPIESASAPYYEWDSVKRYLLERIKSFS